MKLIVNNREFAIDADPAMPLLWALRDILGHDRHQVRLRRRAVRRLHGASGRPGHPLLRHADLRRRGQEDHHDRSRDRWHRPRRCRRACRMGQARRGAVRLLPERPDHERDRLPQVAARAASSRPPPRSTRPWPATSAAAAPMPASAPPSPTPPARSPEGAAMLPNIDYRELPRAAAAPDGAQSDATKPRRCRAAAS